MKKYFTVKNLDLVLRLYLAFVFIVHGVEAFFMPEEFKTLAGVVLKDPTMLFIGLIALGVVDLVVGILLLVKPWRLLILYAALWPIVPSALDYFSVNREPFEFIPFLVIGAILLYIRTYKRGALHAAPKSQTVHSA